MHIPLAQKIRDFAAALLLADSLIMRVPVVSEMAPACATVTMPVMTEGHSWKYAPFDYANTVTPYAARTCVLPLLLPMMRGAMALYTSLETLAETASLYGGTTILLSPGGDCENEYCESDAPTPGAY